MTRLDHVRWIGGSALAGKSTVARALAARSGWHFYSLDSAFEDHRRRDSDKLRRFQALARRSAKELFAPPAPCQAKALWAFYEDEWELVKEDLAALTEPVLAEGAGWLPSLIQEAGALDRAVWLIATPDRRRRVFRADPVRRHEARRLFADEADPEAALQRWLGRDDLFAQRLADEAMALGAQVIEVDGSRSVEATVELVASCLDVEVEANPG